MVDWLLTHAPVVALLISLCAFVISCASLGWNIYRDVIMKPKLRVGLSVSHIIDGSGVSGPPLLMISATNYGPGQITCGMAAVKKSSLFRKIGRRVRRFTVVQDFTNPLCAQLPKRLNMAEEINLVFPYNQGCFLKLRPTHVGLYDSFGRYHSAPRRQVRRAISDYKKDFPNQANS